MERNSASCNIGNLWISHRNIWIIGFGYRAYRRNHRTEFMLKLVIIILWCCCDHKSKNHWDFLLKSNREKFEHLIKSGYIQHWYLPLKCSLWRMNFLWKIRKESLKIELRWKGYFGNRGRQHRNSSQWSLHFLLWIHNYKGFHWWNQCRIFLSRRKRSNFDCIDRNPRILVNIIYHRIIIINRIKVREIHTKYA